jgi:hypothetical protein
MGDARCSDFCDLNFDETLHSNFLLKEGRCRRRPLLGGFSGASLEGKIPKRGLESGWEPARAGRTSHACQLAIERNPPSY